MGQGTHVADGEGTALWFLGGLYEIKVDGEASGGPSVVQVTTPPGPALGAPPHVHDCDEVVYVVEGNLRFHVEGQTQDAGPGSVLHFPQGVEEWFENTTNEGAKILIVYDGGHAVSLFREVAEPAKTRSVPPPMEEEPDLEALAATAARFGVEIRAPPE
ncbi:MAG: cupin domain-containing protein [Thermoplasmata archaeon]|nr:cupin domain-containing protein [Thermoplasmata archaeon]